MEQRCELAGKYRIRDENERCEDAFHCRKDGTPAGGMEGIRCGYGAYRCLAAIEDDFRAGQCLEFLIISPSVINGILL